MSVPTVDAASATAEGYVPVPSRVVATWKAEAFAENVAVAPDGAVRHAVHQET